VTSSGVLAALELLAREVMPRFRGLPAVVPWAKRRGRRDLLKPTR